jgi:hypothetical protein
VDCILSPSAIVRRDPVSPDPTRAELVSARGIEGPRRWTSIDIEILLPSTTNIDPSAKHQLHRRFEVPYCRIVSLPARTVEVYGIAEGACQLLQASGDAAVALPPFLELALVPASR